MRLPPLAFAAALCCAAGLAQAAGLQFFTVPADGDAPEMKGAVWYPCKAPVTEIKYGRMILHAAENCPVAGEKLPLIVVSHGYGGLLTGHHDTAEALADAGFVVAAISHPVDTGQGDMKRADTLALFTERPRDIKRLTDYMLSTWPERARIDAERIGFFGFSRGGYTGLVLIGGEPEFRNGFRLCPPGRPACGTADESGAVPHLTFTHDPRIRAAVIADPAFGSLFTRSALKEVTVPIQLWGSEESPADKVGVSPESVAAVAHNLPVQPQFHTVDAGHFAFLPPCSPEQVQAIPKLCIDHPAGFDRVAFHKDLNAEVLAFFQEHLVAGEE